MKNVLFTFHSIKLFSFDTIYVGVQKKQCPSADMGLMNIKKNICG